MKFTYDNIKENLRIYNEAKALMPVISDYESGFVSQSSMRYLNLGEFVEFYNFQTSVKEMGFNLVEDMKFKKLKDLIIKHTSVNRFKTYFLNRTQPQFKKLLEQDAETYDRLLNGRWISKPNGRRRGRRSGERVEGLQLCFVPIMNYVIQNDIDLLESKWSSSFEPFYNQPLYQSKIKWYSGVHLDITKVPQKEIDITYCLMNSIVDFVTVSEIDFRKLNSDFIVENVSQKIKKLMKIPEGTVIKSLVDKLDNYSKPQLTKDKSYTVRDSMITGGFVRVYITDDTGYGNYHDYRNFEDLSIHRDLLFKQLGL